MSDEAFEYKDEGLGKIISALKGKLSHVEIGVLGKSTIRNKDKQSSSSVETSTNAGIGAIHEYGLNGMPVRSFLRMPINENLERYLEKSGLFKEETLKKVIATGDITQWLELVGIVATQVVEDGFDTGGFGKWEPSKMDFKKVKQTLVETQQLRRSINYRVVK